MPSIALFIKELLEEDKYDGTFTSKIDERIKVLNAAQLQGLYNHLSMTASGSKTEMWRTANQEIVDRIKETLDARMKEAAAEQKIIEEYKLQQKQKKMARLEAEREKQRVQQMIFEKAHNQAEKEVRDKEMSREAKEKLEILQRVFQAEEKRNEFLTGTFLFFVFGSGGVVVAVYFLLDRNIIYMAAGVGFVVIVSLILVYYATTLTNIKPTKVLPEDIEAQIASREQELQDEAYLVLKEKERKFEEQEKRDKAERKRRRQLRREQKQYEIELMEQQRLERIRMAREIVDRQQNQQNTNAIPTDKASSGMSVTSITSSLENHPPESLQAWMEHDDEKEVSGDSMAGWMTPTSLETAEHPETTHDESKDMDNELIAAVSRRKPMNPRNVIGNENAHSKYARKEEDLESEEEKENNNSVSLFHLEAEEHV